MWMIVAPVPVARSTSTETNATDENRGTTTARTDTRDGAPRGRPPRRLSHSTSSPIRPPSQTEPDIEVDGIEEHRESARRGLAGVPDGAGDDEHGDRGEQRAGDGGEFGDRALLPVRAVDPQRDPSGDTEQREAQLEVDVSAAERRHPEQRDERPEIEHRAQRVVGDREVEVDGDRDQSDHRRRRSSPG